MTPTSHELSVSVDVSASLVALVTLAATLVFGLALLPRPSRATIVWGSAFGLGMLGTYLWVAGNEGHLPVLQALSSGLMVTFVPLLWLGLRYHRGLGRGAAWPVAVAAVVGMPTLLVLAVSTEFYPLAFRLVFAVSGVFAALVVAELLALRLRSMDILMPLLLASCAYVVVVLLALIDGAMHTIGESPAQLSLLRDVNGIGTLVYSQCAAVTVILLVRRDPLGTEMRPVLRSPLAERLARAEQHGDTTWSLLDIRLDDPDELRAVAGSAEFARISAMFLPRLFGGLPVTADIVRTDDTRCLVLLSGDDEAVRHHIREILRRVGEIDEIVAAPAAVRPSASIGWVAVADFGFDYDVLCASAADGAAQARAAGGDRWERARPATTRTGSLPVTLEE